MVWVWDGQHGHMRKPQFLDLQPGIFLTIKKTVAAWGPVSEDVGNIKKTATTEFRYQRYNSDFLTGMGMHV